VLLRPVDEPQDRAHTLVDQVDPEAVQEQGEHGIPVHEHHDTRRHEAQPAQDPGRPPGRLAGEPCHADAQRLAEWERLDER
jgi:hypothetical protein